MGDQTRTQFYTAQLTRIDSTEHNGLWVDISFWAEQPHFIAMATESPHNTRKKSE
jgi:hypothetical protein